MMYLVTDENFHLLETRIERACRRRAARAAIARLRSSWRALSEDFADALSLVRECDAAALATPPGRATRKEGAKRLPVAVEASCSRRNVAGSGRRQPPPMASTFARRVGRAMRCAETAASAATPLENFSASSPRKRARGSRHSPR